MPESTKLELFVPVELKAAQEVAAGETPKRPTFEMLAYTGAPMNAGGFHSPVVVDLAGVKTANDSIPILLDHDTAQIIGQGSMRVDATGVHVAGEVMGDSPESKKVLALAKDGFLWKASIGANVDRREFLDAGKTAQVNGAEVTGPKIIARESTLQEVSFVAIGADSKTSAAIAASNSFTRGIPVDPQFKTWLEANGYANTDTLTAQQLKPLEAAWKAENVRTPSSVDTVVAEAKAENLRRQRIADITASFVSETPNLTADQIGQLELLANTAIEAKWSDEKYDHALLKATRQQTKVFRPSALDGGGERLSNRVVEAAICMTGRLENVEKLYDEQTLQAAHDQFRSGIGLRQLILLYAKHNGFRDNYSSDVTIEAQRAAFGMVAPNRLQAAGFSNLNISTTLSNVANKFLMQGWNAVDMTPLKLARIRPVRDFKQITTVSLTGDLIFQQLGPTGEIKHGTLGETVYNNQASTYARMLAVTRTDIINDDLGALTDVPFKLGRGAGLKLNDIFWTPFLGAVASGFFAAGNNNLNTGFADMTVAGLAATEAMFLNQTDPDGFPIGVQAAIIVVPTALKAAALTLMTSERLITGATGVTQGDVNIWRGRFRVESSPYISNALYTGNTSVGWWMMAEPTELTMIEIAALNGRVEPIVEQADADFNVLGIQMRGYADIGVATQEKRAAVYADGGAS